MSIELRTIFFGRRPRRLRAGWRILTQNGLELVLYIFLHFIFFRNVSDATQQAFIFDKLLFVAATTLSIFLARRYLDRHSFDSIGLEVNVWMLWDLLFGFLLAGVLMAGIYTVEYQAGWLKFIGYRWQQDSMGTVISETLAGLLVLGLCPSWQEELSYRGYGLQNIKEGLNLALAIVITSIFFAARHIGNANAGALSTIIIFLAGLWLAFAWLVTQQLWLPLGIHAGWNFFEGVVFGFPVSGFTSFHWIDHRVTGPVWITGGAFGPEAGVVSIVAIIVGAAAVFGWSRWRRYLAQRLQAQSAKI